MKIEWKTWKTLSTLDTLACYWRKSEELITQDAEIEQLLNPPNWHPETESEQAEWQAEVSAARKFHDYDMKRILRYTCTALLYSVVEIELKRFVDNLDGSQVKPQPRQRAGREGFLEALCRHLRERSLDVSVLPQFPCISDLQLVRNCIVHCWGEMKYVKAESKKKLMNISNYRDRGILCPQSAEIRVDSKFLKKTFADTWDFFLHLFRSVQWTVDERWLTNRVTE